MDGVQYSHILSYEYHCLSGDNSGGGIICGRICGAGVRPLIHLHVEGLICIVGKELQEDNSRFVFCDGEVVVIFYGWNILEVWLEEFCPVIHWDASTAAARSLRLLTISLQNRCFSNLKLQSGANLVCPASRNDRVMVVC